MEAGEGLRVLVNQEWRPVCASFNRVFFHVPGSFPGHAGHVVDFIHLESASFLNGFHGQVFAQVVDVIVAT